MTDPKTLAHTCGLQVHDIRVVLAELGDTNAGFAAGIEAAAKVALSLMHGNPTDGFEVGYDNACENIADRIRALTPPTDAAPVEAGELFPERVKDDAFNAAWDRYVVARWGSVSQHSRATDHMRAGAEKDAFAAGFAAATPTPSTNPVATTEVERLAREALFGTEIARTGVTNPANGARSYSWVRFHDQVVRFDEPEYAIPSERDAGTGKASAYAEKINDALFDLAKRAVSITLAHKSVVSLPGESDARFLACIQERAPRGERIEVQYHANGDWSVYNPVETETAKSDAMREALDDLQQAEAEYRLMHDRHGDGSRAAGRAWDLMRRAGDKARAALSGDPS